MSVENILWCRECGREFEDTTSARKHEEHNCVPWEKGNRVVFQYRLLEFTGTIDRIAPPKKPGDSPTVYIHSDVEVEEPEPLELKDGKYVFVSLSAILGEIPVSEN